MGKGLKVVLIAMLLIVLAAGGLFAYNKITTVSPGENTVTGQGMEAFMFRDIRVFTNFEMSNLSDLKSPMDLMTLTTLTYNLNTRWPDPSLMPKEMTPQELMDKAKNPGLGIHEIHEWGITGKGVRVAIIDQPLYQDHPEFEGKIFTYKDFNCQSESSMHGPAVTSLLAGNTIGTAPGVKIYYAAAPSWLADSSYYAQALDWIIEENAKLPPSDKIRVVSVSAAPSGPGSPFKTNQDQWDKSMAKAREDGILVLDCTSKYGIIGPCTRDILDPDNVEKCKSGFASRRMDYPNDLLVPISPRTTAEEYEKGEFSYQYTGEGGLSWAIPYCAGVLALGWEVNPELTSDEMVQILFDTAYQDGKNHYINPKAFIKYIQEH